MNILNNIIHNRQKVKGTQYSSTDEWISKIWYIQSMKGFPCHSACNVGAWVQFLGLKDPLEKGKATLEKSMDCIVHGVAKSQTWLSDFHFSLLVNQMLFDQKRNEVMMNIGKSILSERRQTRKATVIVNFRYQLGWPKGCPTNWKNTLWVYLWVFLEEIST